MATGPRWSLRLRLVGTLLAVVLLNAALLGVVGWAIHATLTTAGAGVSLSLPVAVAGLVVAALALVVVQARLGYRHALESVDARPVDGSGPRGVVERVRRLAIAADAPEPTVAIVAASEANSFTVGNGNDATVVVTTGLLDALPDGELDAVLAHELAHVTNRDVTVATIVATLTAISGALFARERRYAEWIRVLAPITLVGGIAIVVFAGPLLVLLVGYVLVSAVARLLLAINAIVVGLHAQAREYAADRTAASLVGDPTKLASALERLDGTLPREDGRLHASATLGIVPRPVRASEPADSVEPPLSRWLPSDDLFSNTWMHRDWWVYRIFGRIGRALEWRPATHPPTSRRIGRLLDLRGEEYGS